MNAWEQHKKEKENKSQKLEGPMAKRSIMGRLTTMRAVLAPASKKNYETSTKNIYSKVYIVAKVSPKKNKSHKVKLPSRFLSLRK